jgi:hypothetical protein
MPSEDGHLTETCKGNQYLQIESHWTVLTIILENKIPEDSYQGQTTLVRWQTAAP